MSSLMLEWTRSSFCADGACVEIAQLGEHIFMRDSKDPEGLVLSFTSQEWGVFLDNLILDPTKRR
jgi:hypothetical protein